MHPFGGTPICPRCQKAVYLAEQIMGPGRKLYHKPCLTCTTCNKRLDSYSLVEHDHQPFCKQCHVKNFGTRDLRSANLPDRDDVVLSPPVSPSSPTRPPLPLQPSATSPFKGNGTTPSLPPRRNTPGSGATSPPPILRPTRALSPTRSMSNSPHGATPLQSTPDAISESESSDVSRSVSTPPPPNLPPRTIPLNLSPSKSSTPSAPMTRMAVPLMPNATGSRYGAALDSGYGVALTPMQTGGRSWGGGASINPKCGKCGKTVYFAEQVKAIGKTFHKPCLRCTECNTLLDSARLTEKEGDPFCHRCYSKLYGPQGAGYALLGKAGA
ncbi:hypothetical protein C8Q75DRAFT_805799 [Abortiporus biennis]|nr:hypothetical protein C8Q75DRAFT_805799 [Abortiporus biennis]